MKIYVATSWRNDDQPKIVHALRQAGHEVYDFRNPPGKTGFHWAEVGLQRDERGACTPMKLIEALAHPRAVEGFSSDANAMKWADACVLVLPCGRSAHLEAGWMAGAGKRTIVYAHYAGFVEPELMYGLVDGLCVTIDQIIVALSR